MEKKKNSQNPGNLHVEQTVMILQYFFLVVLRFELSFRLLGRYSTT
jgi:hypothetical protein